MILCADDFGLNDAVSTGILDLVQAEKINSVSCLVTTDCWKKRASDLQPFVKNIETGLHLTLTHPQPVYSSGSSLFSLIIKSYLGQLKKENLIREIRKQLELFTEYTKRLPDYVDGHEFCHHFPVIREALMDISEEFHFKKNNLYIRVFQPGKLPFFKNGIFWIFNHLAALPSKKLKKLLQKHNLSFNSRLLGFHPYYCEPKKYFDYYLLTEPSQKDIFFCHPGLPSDDRSDTLCNYRSQIYNFMMSSQFEDMLNFYNIKKSNKSLKL